MPEIKKYLNRDGLEEYNSLRKRREVQAFDTVAEMQAAMRLAAGMTCHTNGFHTSGDGGAAYYTISASGAANGMDVLACQNSLKAALVITEAYVTPEMFGAWGDGVHDDTSCFLRSLTYNHVKAANSYTLSGEINIASPYAPNARSKIVEIIGSIIFNNGFFHVRGENVTLTGGGVISGTAPEALIVLGGTENTQTVSSIKNTITNLYVKNYGDTAGIILRNYFLGNYGCYCNTLDNIYVYGGTNAVSFIGDVNANNVSNIVFRSSSSLVACMFLFDGIIYNSATYAPMENNFNSCFYYLGADTPMIKILASTKAMMNCNVFANLTCEQTGSNASTLHIEDSATPRRNVFVGVASNTGAGDFAPNTQTRTVLKDNNNTFISATNCIIGAIAYLNGMQSDVGFTVGINKMLFQNAYSSKVSENSTVRLFSVNGTTPQGVSPKGEGATIEVTISEFRSGVSRLQHCEKALIYVTNTSATLVSADTATRLSISGYDVNYTTGNNGTSLTDVRLVFDVKVTCFTGHAEYLLTNIIEMEEN